MEGSYGAVSDGGVGIEPWQVPRRGSVGTGMGQDWETHSPGGVPDQSAWNGAGGMGGGLLATGQWPGRMAPAWHRGFYGGPGIRTGGSA